MHLSDAPQRSKMVSERLNAHCFCLSLNHDILRQALKTELGSTQLVELLEQRCPYLFSARPVFISEPQSRRMAEVVAAVEEIVAMPS